MTLHNLNSAKILVDEVSSDIEALWLKSEFAMNIHNPLEEECSRRVLDLGLHGLEVVDRHHIFHLFLSHPVIDFLSEFNDTLWIVKLKGILFWHCFLFSFLVFFQPVLKFLLNFRGVVTFLDWLILFSRGAVLYYDLTWIYLCDFDVDHFKFLGGLNLTD